MTIVKIRERAGSFAEDKDVAAGIRDGHLKPALESGQRIRLDFRAVEGATQSFVHALLSEPIRTKGPSVLDRIEFKNCNPTVRSVIEIVVEYSQLGEAEAQRAGSQHVDGSSGRRSSAGGKRSARTSRHK